MNKITKDNYFESRSISAPASWWKAVEAQARKEDRNNSYLIRKAFEAYLDQTAVRASNQFNIAP